MRSRLAGHFWTIAPTLRHRALPARAPDSVAFSSTLEDQRLGEVKLSGALRDQAGSEDCLVVVHGLGGGPDAFYCVRAAWAAERAGLSCLRLSLRGADRSGEDFYHAGLREDLDAALASPALSRFRRLYVLGYSLGGHMTLRYALSPSDARVRAVAAVCAPLDLDRSAQAIDRRSARVYCGHVLSGLVEIYERVAARRPVPTPLAEVRRITTIRDWDRLTVVPRHGFDSVDHYYASMSVGPRLSELAVPSLVVHSEQDPMVPPWTYADLLPGESAAPRLTVRLLTQGGHVGFPPRVRFDTETPDPLEDHIVRFLQTADT